MKTVAMTLATAAAVALSIGTAEAGWKKKSFNSYSHGLVNVSPSVSTGNLNVLNGTAVLNGSPIASGNVVQGILNGNKTSVGNGILGGAVKNILGGNKGRKRH